MVGRAFDDILAAIGDTPLIRLRKLFAGQDFDVWAKLESLNPGGSIKDRPAREILRDAMERGRVRDSTVIIESSSGNMGVGLAQACCYHGLRFICVVDSKTTPQNIAILRTYGAEIVKVTEPDSETGELLQARLRTVEQLCAEHADSFWPDQYSNENNSGSHYKDTMREVAEALDGRVDYLFCATSTCGTVRGCGEYVREYGLTTRIVAVDALGSLIFQDDKHKRSIPGLGAGLRPPLCEPELIDRVVHVDDRDCVAGCRRLVRSEGILAGGSSGGVITAVESFADRIPPGSVVVALLPDRGERYLDTVFDDEWVIRTCGDLAFIDDHQLGKEDESAVA